MKEKIMDKDLSINQVNQIKLNIVNVKRRACIAI